MLVYALCEQFLDTLSGENVLEDALGFTDEAAAEGTQTELHDYTIVENLSSDVRGVDRLLQVRHEQHVTSGVEVVVEGVVVDVAEHGTGTKERVARLVQMYAEGVNEVARDLPQGDRWLDRRFADRRFECLNDRIWLRTMRMYASGRGISGHTLE